jgi:membrane-bound inhibitor of C-type lysozyme
MKKVFTLLVATALTISASAVEFTVTPNGGTALANGDFLFNTIDEAYAADGEVFIGGGVTIASNETVAVDFKATLTQGFEKYGICVNSSCFPVAVGNSLNESFTISADAPETITVEPVNTSEMWELDMVRTYVFDVTLSVNNAVVKEFNIIITNDANYAALKNITSDDKAFTVSGRYIYWNMPSAPGVMSIYSLDGKVVDQKNLSAASGSTVLNLPEGIYVWTAAGHSGKICIRK